MDGRAAKVAGIPVFRYSSRMINVPLNRRSMTALRGDVSQRQKWRSESLSIATVTIQGRDSMEAENRKGGMMPRGSDYLWIGEHEKWRITNFSGENIHPFTVREGGQPPPSPLFKLSMIAGTRCKKRVRENIGQEVRAICGEDGFVRVS